MINIFAYLAILLGLTSPVTHVTTARDNSEAGKIIESKGYRAERHEFITSDGYRLRLTRMVNPKIKPEKLGRPMMFVHGEFGSAANFLSFVANITGPEDFTDRDASKMSQEELDRMLGNNPSRNSMPFLASNFACDVWYLNRRGSLPSQRHVIFEAYKPNGNRTLGGGIGQDQCPLRASGRDPNDKMAHLLNEYQDINIGPKFWNYSLDQIALVDVPESIEWVLNYTQQDRLDYVGHSTGSAVLLMLLAERPQYSRNISHAILWAPSIYQHSAYLPEKLSAVALLPGLANYSGPWSTKQYTECVDSLKLEACNRKYNDSACTYKDQPGPEAIVDNKEASDTFLALEPNPVSVGQYKQVAQEKVNGKMRKYDYGSRESNMAHYGSAEPPEYQVASIKLEAPISIYNGAQDSTATPGDVAQLVGDLRTPVIQHFINETNVYFTHRSIFNHELVSKLVVIPSFLEVVAQ